MLLHEDRRSNIYYYFYFKWIRIWRIVRMLGIGPRNLRNLEMICGKTIPFPNFGEGTYLKWSNDWLICLPYLFFNVFEHVLNMDIWYLASENPNNWAWIYAWIIFLAILIRLPERGLSSHKCVVNNFILEINLEISNQILKIKYVN